MQTRTKAIIFVMLTISSLTGLFLYIFYSDHKRSFDLNMQFLAYQLDQRMTYRTNELRQKYVPRIKGFIRTHPKIVKAFEERNRPLLYQLNKPIFKVLQAENKYLFSVTFVASDYKVLLRVQDHDSYGDDVSNIPFLRHAMESKEINAGFAICRLGLFYRIVVPIFDGSRFIGIVSWAFKPSFVAAYIRDLNDVLYGIFTNEKMYRDIAKHDPVLHEVSGHILIAASNGNSVFDSIPSSKDIHQDMIIAAEGKEYALHSGRMLNFAGNHIGDIVLAKDITKDVKLFRQQLVDAISVAAIVLMLSFIVLYFSFGSLIGRIENLNETLEQRVEDRTEELSLVNQSLKKEIEERQRIEKEREKVIEELHDALGKVKTLSGMLPICSSCKKIRDDSGYWNQLEAYILDHSDAQFSHSICPECAKKLYPEIYDKEKT